LIPGGRGVCGANGVRAGIAGVAIIAGVIAGLNIVVEVMLLSSS
jgi:hypothetical protein